MAKKNKVSYTQYTMEQNCKLEYKLTYIDKLAPPAQSIHLIFGQAMHEAIQTWLKDRFKDPTKTKKFDYSHILKEVMIKEFKSQTLLVEGTKHFPTDLPTIQEFYLDGIEILDYLYENADELFPTEGYELTGIEIPVNIELRPNLNYIGYLDIVIHHIETNKYYIIDLKTSGKGWSDYQKKDKTKTNQLLLYKLFYSTLFNVPLENIVPKFIILKRKLRQPPEELSYIKPKRITTFIPTHGKISISRAKKSWDEFIENSFDTDGNRRSDVEYKPNPGPHTCRFCPFNNDETLCKYSFYLEKGDG